jgi:dTDP-4-dehydrorhamnose reductase
LLGAAVHRRLAALGLPHQTPPREALNLDDTASISQVLGRLDPVGVINAAAFTDVAAAEDPRHRDRVWRLNAEVPEALARATRRMGVRLVHVSTDYVFDGRSTTPYGEGAPTGPLQEYGRSKLAGEQAVLAEDPTSLVIRTSTLYGPTQRPRPHYVDAILGQARRGVTPLAVVRLPVSAPSFAPDVADTLVELGLLSAKGLVHVVNDGACSRLELASEIVRLAGSAGHVEVVEREAPAGGLQRPEYSVLDTGLLFETTGRRLRTWGDALAEYLAGGA